MSVGILMVTHDLVGRAIVDAARMMLGMCPLKVDLCAYSGTEDRDELLRIALNQAAALDEGDGVLILTDIFGSTPSNIAQMLLEVPNRRAIAGLNLPMLVRVLNYPRLNLNELAQRALAGGCEGVMPCDRVDKLT